MLALTAALLPPPSLTAVADAAAPQSAGGTGPEQRTGTADGRKHELPADSTDANGPNDADPAELPASKGALPVYEEGRGFTPVEPKAEPVAIEAASSEGAPSTATGFDAERSVELPSERSVNSKEFENPDGTRTTRVYTEPVHFRDGSGAWKEIDSTLVPGDTTAQTATSADSADRFHVAADDRELSVAAKGDDASLAALEVGDAGHRVAFGLQGAQHVTAAVRGDTAHYADIRPGADLTLQAGHGVVKETIVLNNREAPREWTFPLLLDGLTPQLDEHGAVVLRDSGGATAAVIPTGWMEDSSTDSGTGGPAVSGDVTYELEQRSGKWFLHVVLDDAWLDAPERQYPVRVDPSVTSVDTDGDSFVQNEFPNTNFAGDDELKVGSYNNGTSKAISFLRFDNVISQLDNRYILNADLGLFNVWSSTCTAQEMTVHQVTGSWSSTTVTWNNRPPSFDDLIASDSFAYGESCGGSKWRVIDLGSQGVNLVQGWVEGTKANHGLALWADFDSSLTWKRFGSVQSANNPYLSITHSAWGARYTVGSQTEPLTGHQGGEVTVTVKNIGDFTWEPLGWQEVRLGTRVRDYDTGAVLDAVAFTRLNERLTPDDSATLDARIPPLPPGKYKINFDMQRLRDQRWFSSESVPVATVTVTSQDVGPRITGVYPHPNGQAGSLTPALFVDAESIDHYPTAADLDYWFEICEGTAAAPVSCVNSTWAENRTWTVPTGKLKWGKQYLWRVKSREATTEGPLSPFYTFTTAVEQPAITSHLGGQGLDGSGREVDPSIGNYTTTDTDAQVATVGPPLTVSRTYNSRDPRSDNAFGAGWSTRFDMRVERDNDGSGNVVVTHPDGRQVRFGMNPDGSYAPPYGGFATLTASLGGGWLLADKNQTSYSFDDQGRITEVTDYRGRKQTMAYNAAGELTTVTGAGGRTLTLTWSGGHVATVSTAPPESGADPLTWSYTYTGDRLTEVCGPEDATGSCTRYTYTDGSHHRTVVRDAGPYSYWRLGEQPSALKAPSDLLLDQDQHAGTYHDVQLGTGGALAGSPDTAATFNGTSSYVRLPDQMVSDAPYLTVELWFRTTEHGVLFSYQDHTLEEDTAGKRTPALYVGTDGKLRGEFWNGTAAPITSAQAVNDGAWHHAALTAAGNVQHLYLDGAQVGTASGEIVQYDQHVVYLGAGYWSNWPATTGIANHFAGDIDEAAIYARPLGEHTIAEHHASAATSQQLTTVTMPSGRVHAQVAYDTVRDRVSSYTDAHGGTYQLSAHQLTGVEGAPATDDQGAVAEAPTVTVTITDPDERKSSYTYDPLQDHRLIAHADAAGHSASYGYDTGGFLAATTAPDGTVTRLGNDSRGNKISQTTCRDTADEATCHTATYEYFLNPDDPLDPRNDQLTATQDARSTSPTDTTYRTTYGYNTHGDRVSTTTPATADHPGGRTVTHTFTDGTEPAVGGGTAPAGLLATTTDARGGITDRAYTDSGDLAQVTDPAGAITEYTHDQLGREVTRRLISDAHPDGVTTTSAYDGESRLVNATVPVTTNHVTDEQHQARTTYSYDADGHPLTEALSDLVGGDVTRTTERTYDTHGRLATLTDPEQRTETYTYDVYGHQTNRTLPGNRIFRYSYTARGDLAEVTLADFTGDPNNPGTPTDVVLDSYAYDPAGRLAEHADAMGRTTSHTYYDDGLPAQDILSGFHDPDGTTRDLVLTERRYDAAGNLLKETTGNGSTTTAYEIDAAGRTTASVLDPGGLARRTAYGYDAGDALTSQTRTGAGGARTEKITYERTITGDVTRLTVENGTEDLVTTRVVDDRGLVLSETGPRGHTSGANPADHTIDFTYDVLGRLIETRAPPVTVESHQDPASTERPTARLGYNTFGEPTETTGPNGHTTRTEYDALGRATTTTLPDYTPPGAGTPLAATITHTYDPAGNLTTETDPLGGTTTYTYDQLGNLAKVTRPAPSAGADAPVSTFTHDLLGEQLSATDPTGARSEATFDDLGRQITSTVIERHPSAGVFTTALTYDDSGNLISTTAPSGIKTEATYNVGGQPTSVINTAQQTTTLAYGPTGLPTAITDPLGRVTRTAHDLAGRTTSVTDEDSSGAVLRTRTSDHDADGNPVEVTDELGHSVTQTFDALGRLTALVEPVDASTSITTTFGYDAAGDRTRLTDGRGNTTWYTHTPHGLPESIVEPATTAHPGTADRTWTTVYDAAGQPVKQLLPGGVSQQRTFDALGRITKVTGSGAEAATTDDTYGYDAAGRLTSVSAPGGTNSYTYDDRGHLLSSGGPSGTATFRYDADGRLATRTDAAGSTTFGYDSAGRLDSAADPLTGATQAYGYDNDSRLTSIAYGGSGATRSLAYDALDRLTSDTLKAPDDTTTASVAYAYDPASRLLGKTTTATAGSGENTYAYDWAGRLTNWTAPDGTTTAYGWDEAGNRTTSAGTTATYDSRNRLLTADTTTYTWTARGTLDSTSTAGDVTDSSFDALGRMITSDGTTYAYDGLGRLAQRGSSVLEYADQSNNLVSGGGQLVFRSPTMEPVSTAASDGTGAAAVLADQHGDVTGTFDPATGTLTGSSAYAPFGAVTAQQGTTGALGYQGEYTDPGSGQVNMHARWYDPTTGGFASRDSWTLNPVPSIAANRHGYANGSPLLNTDPTGHYSTCFVVCVDTRELGRFFDTGKKAAVRAGSRTLRYTTRLLGGFAGALFGIVANATPLGDSSCTGRYGMTCAEYFGRKNSRTSCGRYCYNPNDDSVRLTPGSGPGAGNRCYWCGGNGNSAGGSLSGTRSIPQGPPPPPPPPPWKEIIKKVLAKKHARPAATATIDTAHEQFVDDSTTRSSKELAVTDGEMDEYFKYFPGDTDGCAGGMLGFQCTGNGNLFDPDTGTAYCNPAAGPTPGNTCVPIPTVGRPALTAGAGSKPTEQCTYHVPTEATRGLGHNCRDRVWESFREGVDHTDQGTLPVGVGISAGSRLAAGEYHFVVRQDGSLRAMQNESMWDVNPDAGHTSLGDRRGVLMAGTFDVDASGAISRIDNFSGHYRPTNLPGYTPLLDVTRGAFRRHGWDFADNAWGYYAGPPGR